ncbi:MAG: acylase [Gemmatimonadota bacterium]|nr:acylase [Gemmatimonadota bacterium]
MNRLSPVLLGALIACGPGDSSEPEVSRWEAQAAAVTIIRDDWGIPHIHGKTDADAVFGLIYAHAEDDFNRIEVNYLNAMGRLAEAEGEEAVFQDLRMKLFISPEGLQAQYQESPDWLQALMTAWADGLNYFLHTHPDVQPRVLTRFEPWMALSFSEGSIGGDIERVSIPRLREFYGAEAPVVAGLEPVPGYQEPVGSNGIAVAPANTANGRSLFLINPHTSFFFRGEVQVTSEEGLNAYGAVTWGQFFVYQGFNDRVGWMHTSSEVDNIDEYLETIVERNDSLFYRHGGELRPVAVTTIAVPFRTDSGMASREFTTYRTHHGPVVRRAEDGRWIAVRMMEEPLKALTQSYLRTKARSFAEFREVMDLHTNSSNNTIYADGDGTIAYFHANFVPRRNPAIDWTRPVDGSDPATDWEGVHSVEESPLVVNPGSGWVYNTNNWPYSSAGPDSPRAADFPSYTDRGSENARGLHAIRVLEGRSDFTLDRLLDAAYDSYLTAFEPLIPALLRAYDSTGVGTPLRDRVTDQVGVLRAWDLRWGTESIPTALAIYWADLLARRVAPAAGQARMSAEAYIATRSTRAERLQALGDAADTLVAHFGTWQTPWGAINRFQRLTGEIVQPFADSGASIPVGFTSARWGSLASFGARTYPGTKRMYGTSGNSFVAVVEFGDSVRARAITAGGESGDASSPHFNDQADRYARGDLREVYFYPHQLQGHIEREYRPGRR